MIMHKQFMITYFSTKDGKTITRKGTWTEKCKYFTSKVGNHMMTYFDMDAQGYRFLDEAIELATELGLTIQDSEIIRTNSTGLTIFNPKNLADRIKGMKNKVKQTREEKIAIAKMQQSQAIN